MPAEGNSFPSFHQPRRLAICVFGSGDAMDPANHVTRARVAESLVDVDRENKHLVTVFYGCHQPSMETPDSEAVTMQQYYSELLLERIEREIEGDNGLFYHGLEMEKTIADDRPNSTSTTCELVVNDYLAKGYEVRIIMSGTSMWRTRYLLYRQARRAGLNWRTVRQRITFVSTWDNYTPYVKDKGRLKASLSWFLSLLRETGAWGKALLDPFSKSLNQNRTF